MELPLDDSSCEENGDGFPDPCLPDHILDSPLFHASRQWPRVKLIKALDVTLCPFYPANKAQCSAWATAQLKETSQLLVYFDCKVVDISGWNYRCDVKAYTFTALTLVNSFNCNISKFVLTSFQKIGGATNRLLFRSKMTSLSGEPTCGPKLTSLFGSSSSACGKASHCGFPMAEHPLTIHQPSPQC